MFSLVVGYTGESGEISRDRFVRTGENTVADVVTSLTAAGGELDLDRIRGLPALLMPELSDPAAEQVARVGEVIELRRTTAGRIRFRMRLDAQTAPIPTQLIDANRDLFDIEPGSWELERTHWMVKHAELWRAIAIANSRAGGIPDSVQPETLAPAAVTFTATDRGKELPSPRRFEIPDHVGGGGPIAALMPFGAEFTATYAAMQNAAKQVGLECHRADSSMWRNETILQDIVDLIWDAPFVIVDYTGKNPNVFYELGIAHTWGKIVVPITQDSEAPFDVAANRYIRYHGNAQGYSELEEALSARLRNLVGSSGIHPL